MLCNYRALASSVKVIDWIGRPFSVEFSLSLCGNSGFLSHSIDLQIR